jgi:hypothetical protein
VELLGEGITAAGFAADVGARPSLVAAFAAVRERFGPVDVLEFSPAMLLGYGIIAVPAGIVTLELTRGDNRRLRSALPRLWYRRA